MVEITLFCNTMKSRCVKSRFYPYENENYPIGIDLGVGSVGYAVIDKDYNLVRLKRI